jgi:hypothetical protein
MTVSCGDAQFLRQADTQNSPEIDPKRVPPGTGLLLKVPDAQSFY